MRIPLILDLAADTHGDRVAVEGEGGRLSYTELRAAARGFAAVLAQGPARTVGYLGVNAAALPVALFGAAIAGRPFAPLNYRLTDPALRALATRLAPALVVADDDMAERLAGLEGVTVLPRSALMALPPGDADPLLPADQRGMEISDGAGGAFIAAAQRDPGPAGPTDSTAGPTGIEAGRGLPATAPHPEGSDTAILLFTSGTTGAPKAALLTHANLTAYVMGTVDFAGAGGDEANLVSVPPYHIAGVSALLSSLWAGRRIVQLPAFDPQGWVEAAARHRISHAMLVPTMLARILDALPPTGLPTLRALASGGGRMPRPLIERALQALPQVAFTNAYGLTETSSTICLLGPEDHAAARTGNPLALARLESVGRPLPGVELEIRDASGRPCPQGLAGEVWVRGDQVSGQYDASPPEGPARPDVPAPTDADFAEPSRARGATHGWFPTRDRGWLDADGYLFLDGRLDDVIVRGGENISPGEVEDALRSHPAVADAAVIGLPDPQWGEKVVAVVVAVPGALPDPEALRAHVRRLLRSTRTPEAIHLRPTLPYTETGKLLRRVLRDDLSGG